MEILKKWSLALLLLCSCLAVTQAQSDAVADAFAKSYALEGQAKYSEAIDAIKAHAATNTYEVNLRMGWLYYLSKKYDESVKAYQNAIAKMPAAIEPLLGAVNPLAAQNKWEDVENVYLSILKIDSKNSTVNYRLGLIYYYRKDYTKAEKYFSVSLNLYPFDYDSMLMSAWTYYFLGKYNEAKTLFNRVLLLSPADKSALEGLGAIK